MTVRLRLRSPKFAATCACGLSVLTAVAGVVGRHVAAAPAPALLSARQATISAGAEHQGQPPIVRNAIGTAAWGTTLLKGSDWAGAWASAGDLNVYSNGDGSHDRFVASGEAFECVELAQRWSTLRYGTQPVWWANAADMWTVGPTLNPPFHQLPNGGGTAPQFGDLIVWGAGAVSAFGHVAVVAGTGPGYVDVVEQNWNNGPGGGHTRLAINGSTLATRAGLPVLGWLRNVREMQGYWMLGGDGGVFPYGTAGGYGSTGGIHLNQPVVSMAATATGKGYWLEAGDGGIFPFGDALLHSYGSTGGIHLNKPMVGMAATPTGNGYFLVASDGGIFPFGDAVGRGSTGGIHLNQPIVGMAVTPSGNGYWLVARDGGIFPFGDAGGYGSTGGIHLNQPIVGMLPMHDGTGYWLVAADGGIFPFGQALQHSYGSAGGLTLPAPVTTMAITPSGNGYWLVGADGAVYNFGDAEPLGSMSGAHLNAPMIAMAVAPAPFVASNEPGPTPTPTPTPTAGGTPTPPTPTPPPPPPTPTPTGGSGGSGGSGGGVPGAGRITVCGRSLCDDGTPWFTYGATIYNPGLRPEQSGMLNPQGTVALIQAAHLNTIRIVNALPETGDPAVVPYDPASWGRIDAMIAAAGAAHLHVELDLADYRNVLWNDCQDPYAADWTTFMTAVAGRVNTVTGHKYTTDPTIALVAIAGEPLPVGAHTFTARTTGQSCTLTYTTAELTQFYAATTSTLHRLGFTMPIMGGGLGYLNFASGIDWKAIMALPTNDVCAIKTYGGMLAFAATVASYCAGLGKPLVDEEFGWQQSAGDQSRAASFQDTMSTLRGIGAAGADFWNLGYQMAPQSYEVSPSTPLMFAAVIAAAPRLGT